MRPSPHSALAVVLALLALPAAADVLDPDDFTSLGVLDTPATGSYRIDTNALTITDHGALGTPLFVGEAPVINTATGQVSAVHDALVFPGDGFSNDDGLVNVGTLNLIDAIVGGDVRSPAGSQIQVAGAVEFIGLVSGAASFSGTQNLIVFNGGYSPGD